MSIDDLGIETLDLTNVSQLADRINNKDQNNMDNYVRLPEKEGFVVMRILPKLKNRNWYESCRVHRLGEYPNSKTVFCTAKLTDTPRGLKWIAPADKKCPICEKYNGLWEQSKKCTNKTDIENLQKTARSIKPVERYYFNVIVRSQLNPKTNTIETNVGPKIFSCGKTVFDFITLSIHGNPTMGKKGLGDIAMPQTGRDFRLVKTLKGGTYPNYDQSAFEDVSPLGTDEQIAQWVKSYHQLEAIPQILPVDDIKKILQNYLEGGSQTTNETISAPVTQSVSPVPKVEKKDATKVIEEIVDADWDSALNGLGIK